MAIPVLNKTYSFSTLAPAIIGNAYTLLKVKALLSAEQAVAYRDVYTLHDQLKQAVPTLPVQATDLTYILFESLPNESGVTEKIILAYEWLDDASIVLVTSINIRADINNVSTGDLTAIRTLLLEHGYSSLTLTTF